MTSTMLIEVIGLLGVASYVVSYALLQIGLIRGNGYIYPLMNLIGASFIAISLLNNWNFWQLMISIAFGAFSIIGMTRVYLANRQLHFTPEEREVYDRRFTMLTRGDMRRFLSAGQWVDGSPGDVLTTQNKPVAQLVYIASGGVDIVVGQQKITEIGAGEFIGELASLDNGLASATVRLNQPSRYFSIPSETLRALVRNKPDLRAQLEYAFAGNIRSKLLATNARLEALLSAQQETDRVYEDRARTVLVKAAGRANQRRTDL